MTPAARPLLAANMVGISTRTLRNKLNEYADGGLPIAPAGSGDDRAVMGTISNAVIPGRDGSARANPESGNV